MDEVQCTFCFGSLSKRFGKHFFDSSIGCWAGSGHAAQAQQGDLSEKHEQNPCPKLPKQIVHIAMLGAVYLMDRTFLSETAS